MRELRSIFRGPLRALELTLRVIGYIAKVHKLQKKIAIN